MLSSSKSTLWMLGSSHLTVPPTLILTVAGVKVFPGPVRTVAVSGGVSEVTVTTREPLFGPSSGDVTVAAIVASPAATPVTSPVAGSTAARVASLLSNVAAGTAGAGLPR